MADHLWSNSTLIPLVLSFSLMFSVFIQICFIVRRWLLYMRDVIMQSGNKVSEWVQLSTSVSVLNSIRNSREYFSCRNVKRFFYEKNYSLSSSQLSQMIK
jgi:hypothetical protein